MMEPPVFRDGVLEVHVDVPYSINAVPQVPKEARATLLARGATLTPARDGEGPATAELVVPTMLSDRPSEYRPSSVWAAEASVPPKLNVKRHEIDLAFAVTDYKVQGKTLDYIILSIGPRDGLMPHLSLTDVYTLASRVRLGSRLYVVGFDPKKESAHLRKLKHNPVLAIWEAGYADGEGVWDAARAAYFAGELAKRSAKDGRKRRRGTGAASARKKQAAPAARSPVDASDGEGHEQMRDASDAQDDGASMSEGE